MNKFSNVEAWFAVLWHHHLAGTLPPAPTVVDGPVPLPPIPDAAIAPSTSAPATPATAEWTNGMSQPRADGLVRIETFIEAAKTNPHWARPSGYSYGIDTALKTFLMNAQQRMNYTGNFNADFGEATQDNNPDDTLATHSMVQAHVYSQGYRELNQGDAIADGLFFRGPNGPGNPGVQISDMPQFIANCDAKYAQLIADGASEDQAVAKAYPLIQHGGNGVVA